MPPVPWYANPAWYALGISLVALAFSGFSFFLTRRKASAEIERGLILQANFINDKLMQHGIRGPYAHYLGVSEVDVKKFTEKAVILFLHLNLLRDVFHQRDVLEKTVVANYEKWARDIVGPWIQADEDLCRVWLRAKESTDWFGPHFIQWASQHLKVDAQKALSRPASPEKGAA